MKNRSHYSASERNFICYFIVLVSSRKALDSIIRASKLRCSYLPGPISPRFCNFEHASQQFLSPAYSGLRMGLGIECYLISILMLRFGVAQSNRTHVLVGWQTLGTETRVGFPIMAVFLVDQIVFFLARPPSDYFKTYFFYMGMLSGC